MIVPTHPHGVIRGYRDFADREQVSVDGPNGHVLVTSAGGRTLLAWHADSCAAIIRTSDRKRAIRVACKAAGLNPALLTWDNQTAGEEPSP